MSPPKIDWGGGLSSSIGEKIWGHISQSLVGILGGLRMGNWEWLCITLLFVFWTRDDDDASLDGNLLPCKQGKRENLYNRGLSCMHLEDKSGGWSKWQDQAISGDMHVWCMSCGHGALLSPPAYERIEYWYVFMPVLLAFLCSHADWAFLCNMEALHILWEWIRKCTLTDFSLLQHNK